MRRAAARSRSAAMAWMAISSRTASNEPPHRSVQRAPTSTSRETSRSPDGRIAGYCDSRNRAVPDDPADGAARSAPRSAPAHESEDADHDEVDRDDVVEQPGADEDQDSRDQRDDRGERELDV